MFLRVNCACFKLLDIAVSWLVPYLVGCFFGNVMTDAVLVPSLMYLLPF